MTFSEVRKIHDLFCVRLNALACAQKLTTVCAVEMFLAEFGKEFGLAIQDANRLQAMMKAHDINEHYGFGIPDEQIKMRVIVRGELGKALGR